MGRMFLIFSYCYFLFGITKITETGEISPKSGVSLSGRALARGAAVRVRPPFPTHNLYDMEKYDIDDLARQSQEGGLMAYIRLGRLIGMGLIVQKGSIRNGMVELELTGKGRDVLAQEFSGPDTDSLDNRQLQRVDYCLLGLLENCQKDSPCQTLATERESP